MAWRWRCGRTNPTQQLAQAYDLLVKTRPTAINLKWALDEMMKTLGPTPRSQRAAAAYARAAEIADEDVAINQSIGRNGFEIIKAIAAKQEARRDDQHPHPLQCRLAGHGGLGHGDGADLHRA